MDYYPLSEFDFRFDSNFLFQFFLLLSQFLISTFYSNARWTFSIPFFSFWKCKKGLLSLSEFDFQLDWLFLSRRKERRNRIGNKIQRKVKEEKNYLVNICRIDFCRRVEYQNKEESKKIWGPLGAKLWNLHVGSNFLIFILKIIFHNEFLNIHLKNHS